MAPVRGQPELLSAGKRWQSGKAGNDGEHHIGSEFGRISPENKAGTEG